MENRKKIKIAKLFQAITYWPICYLLKFFVHYKVYGQENLKGLENKAIIFASNHTNFIDGPISAAVMPRYKKELYPKQFFPIRFLALGKYFSPKYLLVALYVWINGSIKVWAGTGQDLNVVLGEAIDALKNNGRLWIYPEGKMSRNGKLQQGRRGVAYLHQQTNVPIVPVAIKDTFRILSLKTLLRTRRVSVYVGKPIYSLGDVSMEDGVAKVMSKIAGLLENRRV